MTYARVMAVNSSLIVALNTIELAMMRGDLPLRAQANATTPAACEARTIPLSIYEAT
jgi:hypothetical protein